MNPEQMPRRQAAGMDTLMIPATLQFVCLPYQSCSGNVVSGGWFPDHPLTIFCTAEYALLLF